MMVWIAIFAIGLRHRPQQSLQGAADRRERDPRSRDAFAPRRCRGLLLTQLFQDQEPIGQHHQAGVVMEPTPRPPLEMIQAQFFLYLLVALLYRPATLPEPDRLHPARPRRQVRGRGLELAVGLLLDQQPLRLGEGALAPLPALRRPDPHPGELPRQLPLGPFPPGHLAAGETPGHLPQPDRLRASLGQAGVRPRTAPG